MIRLFHVSDVHFGGEDKAALAWFDAVVAADRPDAVLVTGDLTLQARAAEFAAASAWLARLNVPVAVSVGNHDLPYFDLLARFTRPYARFAAIERAASREIDLPGVAIVPLVTTARFQWRLNWSKGNVSARSLARTLAAIAALPAGQTIIVTCHHPLIDAGTRTAARTRGGTAALAALAAAGVSAVLTGHVHDPFDVAYDAGNRTVRLIGAGTLSERVRATPPSFNEIRIVDGVIAVAVRAMAQ